MESFSRSYSCFAVLENYGRTNLRKQRKGLHNVTQKSHFKVKHLQGLEFGGENTDYIHFRSHRKCSSVLSLDSVCHQHTSHC